MFVPGLCKKNTRGLVGLLLLVTCGLAQLHDSSAAKAGHNLCCRVGHRFRRVDVEDVAEACFNYGLLDAGTAYLSWKPPRHLLRSCWDCKESWKEAAVSKMADGTKIEPALSLSCTVDSRAVTWAPNSRTPSIPIEWHMPNIPSTKWGAKEHT